jgi:hypothetical protein
VLAKPWKVALGLVIWYSQLLNVQVSGLAVESKATLVITLTAEEAVDIVKA